MALMARAQWGLGCGLVVAVGWISAGAVSGQTVNQPRYALQIAQEKEQAQAPTASRPGPDDRAYRYPPASDYGYAYPYGNPYAYPGPYGWAGPETYRMRQWGPHGPLLVVPGRPFQGPWIDDDYRQWRYWDLTKRNQSRTQRLLETQGEMMSRGLMAFAKGRYEEARSAFVLAASMNKGDPAPRLHAAHSCFALGRYEEAVRWLGEAFHLEPRIRELPFDIRTDYGNPAHFEQQMASLNAAVAAFPDEPIPLILLGYVRFFTGEQSEAYPALAKAKQLMRKDTPRAQQELVADLLEVCQPSRFAVKRPSN